MNNVMKNIVLRSKCLLELLVRHVTCLGGDVSIQHALRM